MTTPVSDERIRTWLLFIAGLVILVKYAFWTTTQIDPLLTTLVVGCLWGKGMINIWKGGDKK